MEVGHQTAVNPLLEYEGADKITGPLRETVVSCVYAYVG